jgi:Fe2+ transport system protein FeoA
MNFFGGNRRDLSLNSCIPISETALKSWDGANLFALMKQAWRSDEECREFRRGFRWDCAGRRGEFSICEAGRNGRILKSDYSGRSLRVRPLQRPIGVRRLSVLSELNVGESGVLVGLDLPESVQNHLMHMGFVPNALVTVLLRAPAGDPTVYGVDGMEIALRRETAAAIRVRAAGTEDALDEGDGMEFEDSHPSRKDKDAARVGRPELIEAAR